MPNPLKNLSRLITAMLISGVSLSSHGALPYIEEAQEIFKEATFVWPTPPGPSNPHTELQTYEVPQPSSGTYQIELNSLTLGSDEVIRMVLVQTSTTGVQNVSFEGVRCKTGERKLYAFLKSDGTWNEYHQARWQAIQNFASAKHIVTLAKNFLCAGGGAWGSVKDIQYRLRQGGEKWR